MLITMTPDPSKAGWVNRGLVALALTLLAADLARAPSVHLDFAPLYGAAVLATEGRLFEAYEADGKRAGPVLTQAVHNRGYPLRHCLRYLHPPALAYLFSPFVMLDFPFAATLFRALSLTVLALTAMMLARMAAWGGTGFAFLVLFLLCFDPIRMTLELGQTNTFVLALVCVALLARRNVLAGLAIGLALVVKTYAMMLVVAWLSIGGAWRSRALWAALALSVIHASAYLMDPKATFAYINMLSKLSQSQFLWPEQQSFAALLTRIESGFEASQVSGWTEEVAPAGIGGDVAPVFALLVAVTVFFWAWRKRPDGVAAAALALPAGLLASPVLHSHYGAILVVSVVWLVANAFGRFGAWLGILGLALQALPLHSDEARAWVPLLSPIGIHWFFVTYRLIGVVMVFLGVLIAIRGVPYCRGGNDRA